MNTLGAVMSFRPKVHHYDVFSGEIASLEMEPFLLPDKFKFLDVSVENLAILGKGRPGYENRARRYLRAGYAGVAVITDGAAVSLSWSAINIDDRPRTIRGYFKLFPGEGYGFAEWTHPNYRRMSLQKALGAIRLERLALEGAQTLVSNIEPNNTASIAKTLEEGRQKIDTISMISIGNRYFPLKQRVSPLSGGLL